MPYRIVWVRNASLFCKAFQRGRPNLRGGRQNPGQPAPISDGRFKLRRDTNGSSDICVVKAALRPRLDFVLSERRDLKFRRFRRAFYRVGESAICSCRSTDKLSTILLSADGPRHHERRQSSCNVGWTLSLEHIGIETDERNRPTASCGNSYVLVNNLEQMARLNYSFLVASSAGPFSAATCRLLKMTDFRVSVQFSSDDARRPGGWLR